MDNQPPPFPLPPSSPQPSTTTTSSQQQQPPTPPQPSETNPTTLDNSSPPPPPPPPPTDSHQPIYHGFDGSSERPRKRRRYDEDERLVVKAVRAVGACPRCRTKRIKCKHARANLRALRESKAKPDSNDVPTPAEAMFTPDPELMNSYDSGYLSSGERRAIVQEYASDLSDEGNPTLWYQRTLSPAHMEGEDMILDSPQPSSTSVDGLCFLNTDGELAPPQHCGSYQLEAFPPSKNYGYAHSDIPPFLEPTENKSIQPKSDHPTSFWSLDEHGQLVRRGKDLSDYVSTAAESLEVQHLHVRYPGEGIPFQVSTGIESLRPDRERPEVPTSPGSSQHGVELPPFRLTTETSFASSSSEGRGIMDADMASPAVHASMQAGPGMQVPQHQLQNNSAGALYTPNQFATNNARPQFTPSPNQQQQAWAPSTYSSPEFAVPFYPLSMALPYVHPQQPSFPQPMGYDDTMRTFSMHNGGTTQAGMDYPRTTGQQSNLPQMPLHSEPVYRYSLPPENYITGFQPYSTQPVNSFTDFPLFPPPPVNNFAYHQPQPQSTAAWSNPPNHSPQPPSMPSDLPSLTTNTTDSSQPFTLSPNYYPQNQGSYAASPNPIDYLGFASPAVATGYGHTSQNDPERVGEKPISSYGELLEAGFPLEAIDRELAQL